VYGNKNSVKAPDNYGTHNLSLTLATSNTNKMENNLSPYNYNGNPANKTAYDKFDEKSMKSPYNDAHHQTNPFYNHSKDKQSIYGESSYQKTVSET
jgi:hypothetical protein